MAYRVHRGGDHRWVLQDTVTGAVVGLMICPLPGESPRAFDYDFGSTFGLEVVVNRQEFPDLEEKVPFFAIEYLGAGDFNRLLTEPSWEPLRSLLLAEAKFIPYQAPQLPDAPPPWPSRWHHTPPNPKGHWKIPAWQVWVEEFGCGLGNRDGWLWGLDATGEPTHSHQIPAPVQCLAQGITGETLGDWAACADGWIYDLRGKTPQGVYQARHDRVPHFYHFFINALVCLGGAAPPGLPAAQWLLVDGYGKITCLDDRWQPLWSQETQTHRTGFIAIGQGADQGIYQGHQGGIAAYDWPFGHDRWQMPTSAPVLWGQMTPQGLIFGQSDGWLCHGDPQGNRKTGDTVITPLAQVGGAIYSAVWDAPRHQWILADHRGYCTGISAQGQQRWQVSLTHGAVLALAIQGDRLYGTTTQGTLACWDLTTLPRPIPHSPTPPSPTSQSPTPQSPTPQSPPSHSPTPQSPTSHSPTPHSPTPHSPTPHSPTPHSPIILECVAVGKNLKMRVVTPGYRSDWFVQCPKADRQVGARYQVPGVVVAKGGNFYRAIGPVEPLTPSTEIP